VLVDVISKPDASVVQRAPSTAWAIYEPKPCSDRAVLLARSIVPVKRPPEITQNLGRSRALHDAGQYEEAARLAASVLDDARARKDRGLELEALIEVASAKAEVDPPAAVATYEQAVQLAEALGRDLDAAGALGGLANLAGVSQNDYRAAHRYIALALAKLDRMGGENLALRGTLAATEAQVYSDENRLGEAETSIRQAAAALEQAYGSVHPKVGAVYGTLAQILRYQDKDSQPASERTLSIMRDTLGPEHPTTAGAEMTLGQVLADKGRYDEALALYAHADTVFAKSFGESSLVRGSLLANVATLELQREKWDAALAGYRKVLAIIEANEGPDHIDASGLHGDIARALASKGDMRAAFAEMDRSIKILEKAGGDGEPRLIGRLTELAEYQIVAKQPAAGVATAERALAVTKKRPDDANPVEVGQLQFVLARGLWDSHGDKQRARNLVSEALELSQDPKEKAMYQTWLAEHPLQSVP